MSQGANASDTYTVEVSGWNLDETFFVEQSDLEWSESAHKINLRHAVRKGSFVFVRLVNLNAPGLRHEAAPVPYEVIRVDYLADRRMYETALLKITPRTVADSQVHVSDETTQGVLQ